LKGLNLPKFVIVGYFQIKIVAKPLPGRRPHGLFQCGNKDIPLDALISADLLDYPL